MAAMLRMTWLNEIWRKYNQGEDISRNEIKQLLIFADETVKAIERLNGHLEIYSDVVRPIR